MMSLLSSRLLQPSSSTSTTFDKREFSADQHFRWVSIRRFIYIASTFSGSSMNFDIFSRVMNDNVRIYDFIVLEIILGITYMCMDIFIKQYTRKIDLNTSLNPLLRGVTFGIILQSTLWLLIHASHLADALRFTSATLHSEPLWAKCQLSGNSSFCVPIKDVLLTCRVDNKTKLSVTSPHFHYMKTFKNVDKNSLTTRVFVIALVWITNFLFATVTEMTLLKCFKFVCIWKWVTTFFAAALLMLTGVLIIPSKDILYMVDINTPQTFSVSIDHISLAFGIGLVGVYDFGIMSPYTMVDNAVVLFAILFTSISLVKSLIVRALYLALTKCVSIEIQITQYYLLFAILPFSSEVIRAQKLYGLYIFINLVLTLMAYIVLITLTIAKILQSEFRTINNVYIVGVLCFVGFCLSIPISIWYSKSNVISGLIFGLNATVLYLGGYKSAVVMWIYGVERFSTDIHFWLGFKPTKFWTICWVLMPVVLLIFLLEKIIRLYEKAYEDMTYFWAALFWIILTFLLVEGCHIKSIAKYLLHNNLMGACQRSPSYGPPDPDDRKNRRNFNEILPGRKCAHGCIILDDITDCNHLPIMFNFPTRASLSGTSQDNESSMTHIYQAGPSKHRHSSLLDIEIRSHVKLD